MVQYQSVMVDSGGNAGFVTVHLKGLLSKCGDFGFSEHFSIQIGLSQKQ